MLKVGHRVRLMGSKDLYRGRVVEIVPANGSALVEWLNEDGRRDKVWQSMLELEVMPRPTIDGYL